MPTHDDTAVLQQVSQLAGTVEGTLGVYGINASHGTQIIRINDGLIVQAGSADLQKLGLFSDAD